MKKIFFILLALLSFSRAFSQIKPTNPVNVPQMTWYKDVNGHMWAYRGSSLGYIQMLDSTQSTGGSCVGCALLNSPNTFNSPNVFNNLVTLNNSAVISPATLGGTSSPILFVNNSDGKISASTGLAFYNGTALNWNMTNIYNSGAVFNSTPPDFNNSFNFNNGNDFSVLNDNNLLVFSPSNGNRVGYIPLTSFNYTASNGITKDVSNFKLGGAITDFTPFDISQGTLYFTSDGTQYGFKNFSIINSQGSYFASIDTTTTGRAVISVNSAFASIGAQKGVKTSSLVVDSARMTITDAFNGIGLQNAGNYHASYATHPKALTDVSYVDSIKRSIDTLIAQITTASIIYTAGTGVSNTFTNSSLINQFIDGVWRNGIEYQIISGTPTGNQVAVNTTIGTITFQDNIGSSEYIKVRYRGISGTSIGGSALQVIRSATYADMNTQLSGTGYKVFYVQADEVNGGGLPTQYLYYNGFLIRNVPQQAN